MDAANERVGERLGAGNRAGAVTSVGGRANDQADERASGRADVSGCEQRESEKASKSWSTLGEREGGGGTAAGREITWKSVFVLHCCQSVVVSRTYRAA